MARSSARGVLIGLTALTAAGSAAPLGAVEVREGEDYVAIIVEAEEYVTSDERWILTDATTAPTPETTPDPDGNHSAGASGGIYLEVLPDHRQTHDLTVPEGTPLSESFWRPGAGPTLTYAVSFPEPGRYYTHVRAFSTGSEDNGIHIGLNGQWPSSGKALQLCTSGARDWRWSNKQRESGGYPCGIRDTIWLDVEEAGPATLVLSAREDGFELDRVMLIKDRSDNTRRCAPVFDSADQIDCSDGGIEVSDEIVDLDVSLSSPVEEGVVGDRITLAATLGNRDRLDIAHDVALVVAADADDWRLIDAPDGCERVEGDIVCEIGEVHPTPVDEDARYDLTFEALRPGLLRLEASVTATEIDDVPDNDADSVLVEIEEPVRPTTLIVTLDGLPGVAVPGASVPFAVLVGNAGEADAFDVAVSISLPAGLVASSTPEGCESSGSDVTAIDCAIGSLAVGKGREFALAVSSADEGDYAVGVRASASNAPLGDAVGSLDVSEPVTVEVEPEEPTYAETNAEAERETDGGGDVDVDETPVAKPVPELVGSGAAGAIGPLLALVLVSVGVARRRARHRDA